MIDELQRSIAGYVAICHELSVEPFVNLPAAPAKYWKMWEKSKASIHSEIATPRIPDKGSRMPRTEIKVAA